MSERENTNRLKLFVAAICAGRARWESLSNSKNGEICTLGLRHFTQVDACGLPIISSHCAEALMETMG